MTAIVLPKILFFFPRAEDFHPRLPGRQAALPDAGTIDTPTACFQLKSILEY